MDVREAQASRPIYNDNWEMERGGELVWLCIEAAAENAKSVEKWQRQRRTLERLPSSLANALFHLLLRRRLLYPSLLEVFQFCVEEVDFRGENCVDAEWMAYVGAFRYLNSLNLSGCRGIRNSVIWPITGMVSLKDLDLSRCSKITDSGIEQILSIPNLEKLSISLTRVTSKGIKQLASLVKLRSLNLGGLPCTDQALGSLTALVKLEHLVLWGSEITDKGSLAFTRFPLLSNLDIAWTKVTTLSDLPSLVSLNMSNCTIHSISSVNLLGKPSLTELLVHGSTFSDVEKAFSHLDPINLSVLDLSSTDVSSFNFLAGMCSLERLNLSSSSMADDLIFPLVSSGFKLGDLNLSSTKITAQSLSILVGNLPNLENLSLSETMIDDSSLQHLAGMPSLRTLDLSKTGIKGFIQVQGEHAKKSSLLVLQNLAKLEVLNLEGTRVRDEAVHPLGLLKGLKSLYLKSDFLSDVSFHMMSSLQTLSIIGFQGCVLSDSGLLSFRPPETLQVLDVRGCWLLTEEALSSFCGSFPNIKLKHELIRLDEYDFERSQRRSLSKMKSDRAGFQFSSMGKVKDERIKYKRKDLTDLASSPPSEAVIISLSLLPEELKTMGGHSGELG
ncbi:leucine-rich repeat (LRR) family protein [Wolffia australiana]